MIVVDVNVVVYLLTVGPRRSEAVRLWKADPDWRVPPLWRHECLNVLATLTRRDFLDEANAVVLWERALALFAAREVGPDMVRALRLAVSLGISAYDAQYAALAEALESMLVTEDKRLRSVLPGRAVSLTVASAM